MWIKNKNTWAGGCVWRGGSEKAKIAKVNFCICICIQTPTEGKPWASIYLYIHTYTRSKEKSATEMVDNLQLQCLPLQWVSLLHFWDLHGWLKDRNWEMKCSEIKTGWIKNDKSSWAPHQLLEKDITVNTGGKDIDVLWQFSTKENTRHSPLVVVTHLCTALF